MRRRDRAARPLRVVHYSAAVNIKRLRKRLGDDARRPLYIHTELRVGYRMPRPGDT